MRVVHVVALVSAHGEYGGPTGVCFDQARELVRRGHEVTVLAGTWGDGNVEPIIRGVTTHLFPAKLVAPRLGFASLTAPGLARALKAEARTADVVHIHIGRDLLTLSAGRVARKSGVRYVLQTHGMIDSSRRLSAAMVDALLTRPVVQGAAQIFTLTKDEDREIERLAGRSGASTYLRNGLPASGWRDRPSPRYSALFLARLHPRKGLSTYIDAAVELAIGRDDVRFAFAGPDEGALYEALRVIEDAGLSERIVYLGAIDPSLVKEVMAASEIYCLPAEHEPFGMTFLEAMSVGTPVVLHSTSRLAPEIIEGGAGVAFGNDVTLVHAMSALLDDEPRRAQSGDRARDLVTRRFGVGGVVDVLESEYTNPGQPTSGQSGVF